MHIRLLSPLTASDGENLALYRWVDEESSKEAALQIEVSRGVVLLVHGLGEHAGRYDALASVVRSWGFDVRGYDQRGHGQSGGKPGTLPEPQALVTDLADVIDDVRSHCPGQPLILLGHSLGGLVASRLVSLKLRQVDGLVLSSPALDAGLGVVQQLLLAVLPGLLPNMTVSNGLNVRYLSHDARVVQAYEADRLVHNRISPRLGKFISTAGPAVIAAAKTWQTPTLLLYAGQDKLVNPNGSRRFAQIAAASPGVKPGCVTAQCFDDLYHEIFNELQATPVFLALKAWLNLQFKRR